MIFLGSILHYQLFSLPVFVQLFNFLQMLILPPPSFCFDVFLLKTAGSAHNFKNIFYFKEIPKLKKKIKNHWVGKVHVVQYSVANYICAFDSVRKR